MDAIFEITTNVKEVAADQSIPVYQHFVQTDLFLCLDNFVD
ncbi:hypothetical protein [Candidatus Enterococcus murrayae]|nr:hypothetical protein [Enterococcus sp. MJM16]